MSTSQPQELSTSMIVKLAVLGGIGFLFFFIGMMQNQASVMLLTALLSLGVNFGLCYAIARYRSLTSSLHASLAYSAAPLIMTAVTALEALQGQSSSPVIILFVISSLTFGSGLAGAFFWIKSKA